MQGLSILNNRRTDTLSHALHTRTKLYICFIMSVVTLILSSPNALLPLLGGAIIYALCAVRPVTLLKIAVIIALMLTLSYGCAYLMSLVIPRMKLNFMSVGVPFMRIYITVFCILPLALSTSIQSVFAELKSIKMPLVLYLPTTVMLRFIPSFMADIRQIADAALLSGFRVSFKNTCRHPGKTFRYVFFPLIVRALRSADDLAIAAELKGARHSGNTRKIPSAPYKTLDLAFISAAVFIWCGALILQRWNDITFFIQKGF